MEFLPYSNKQVFMILKNRAHESLRPKAWCNKDLEKIAESSGGDARIAIQALRIAAYLAEKRGASHIKVGDIEQGMKESSELRRKYVLKGLSEHHRFLYHLVKESGEINSVELWKKYNSQGKEHGLEPMARRTYNHYKQYLVRNRLLEERQGKGRANQRYLKVLE